MADKLTFVLDGGESLSFALVDDGDLTFDVSTPRVINADAYDGDYEVIPKTYSQTLGTKLKFMTDDMTIKEIPYFETSNEDGTTVYIANTIA